MSTFRARGNQFFYNDQPLQVLSGAIHYFRVVPEYWEDRLLKLKACGFQTVETYVPWNLHEPEEGKFHFTGMADIEKFITLAGDLGLHVIVRPCPYICAEWEFGGLPAWLLRDPNMKLRCSHPLFLSKIDAYYDVLLGKLKPLLCTNGGPIIALQVENEYGSYGNDKIYLTYLKDALIHRGMDVLLFTSDGFEDFHLQGGTLLPELLATVNFGSRPEKAFAQLQKYQPEAPLFCMEYWNGWFDHWGEEHHTRDGADVANVLDQMLKMGASVNFYMFHGGTNFGFMNGANYDDRFMPTVTSYDYDSPLSECGDLTEKYAAVKEVMSHYTTIPKVTLPPQAPKKNYGEVQLQEQAHLFESFAQITTKHVSAYIVPMEQLGQNYGFIYYETKISGPRARNKIVLQHVRDRALIYLDGIYQGVIERDTHHLSPQIKDNDIVVEIGEGGVTLGILVENMGRVNYGELLGESKGITEGVRLGQQFLFGWTIYPLPLDDLSQLEFAPAIEGDGHPSPAFYRGTFKVEEVGDTFLKLDGWNKGVVFINGFNLGRYWERKPQKTLYVPGPLLHEEENEIVIFEQHDRKKTFVTFQAFAELDASLLNSV